MQTGLTRTRPYLALAVLAVGLMGVLPAYIGVFRLKPTHWFDTHEVRLYYKHSGWAAGQGTLYREIPSEYPPAANLVFGLLRWANDRLPWPAGEQTFCFLWIVTAWALYLWLVCRAAEFGWPAAFVWLTPGAVFFAVTRFDIYPAAATFVALLALRADRPLRSAVWFGVALALKVYMLFALPALLVYVLQTRGWRTAFLFGLLCAAPMALSNLTVLALVGYEGMLSPYLFHAVRVSYGESTYDAFYFLAAFLFDRQPEFGGRVPQMLELACALAAAGMRPRTFDDLIRAMLVALVGFITFSVFYSPQYVIWLLPLLCLSEDVVLRRLGIVLGWVEFLYFPVFHVYPANTVSPAHPREYTAARVVAFRACVVLVAALQLAIGGRALFRWWTARREPVTTA